MKYKSLTITLCTTALLVLSGFGSFGQKDNGPKPSGLVFSGATKTGLLCVNKPHAKLRKNTPINHKKTSSSQGQCNQTIQTVKAPLVWLQPKKGKPIKWVNNDFVAKKNCAGGCLHLGKGKATLKIKAGGRTYTLMTLKDPYLRGKRITVVSSPRGRYIGVHVKLMYTALLRPLNLHEVMVLIDTKKKTKTTLYHHFIDYYLAIN